MKIFSFCIYGDDIKYYLGLRENIRLIREYFPEFHIFMYCGKFRLNKFLDSLKSEFPDNTHFIDTEKEGVLNTIYRYSPLLIEDVEIVVIRDTDSEINSRDRWIITDFLNESDPKYSVQVIRDHYWHKSRIMGGLTLFKNSVKAEVKREFQHVLRELDSGILEITYGFEEILLSTRIYPLIKNEILVYSNICVFSGENRREIDFENTGQNFCGNVVGYEEGPTKESYIKKYQFDYFDYPILTQIYWLFEQNQHDLILSLVDEYGFHNISFSEKSNVLDYVIISTISKNTVECIRECFIKYRLFAYYDITPGVKSQLPAFFNMVKRLGYSVVGTCDTEYIPEEKQFVIYFGNYPDDYMSLPQSFKIYRHFLFFNSNNIKLDRFISNKCWNSIDRIFIMGLEGEFERMNDIWGQLCLMHAPLDRIEVYHAKKDYGLNNIYVGATKNHINCLQKMKDSGYECCLFLEDDFVFTSRIRENQATLSEFFNRIYDYNICFLSASKYHERGIFDDLLIKSKQYCTTSSGYLISKRNLDVVLETVKEGYELLIKNVDLSHLYCIDRYWAKLDKIYIFKKKFGFQKPSRSKITGSLNIELD
jgi:hypothetical protein